MNLPGGAVVCSLQMGSSARGDARWRLGRWLLLLPPVLIGFAASQFVDLGLANGPTIEASEEANGFAWRPASATVSSGGTVTFKNPSTLVPHGLAWRGGPETPSCTGVPVDSSGTSWSGACTFTRPGTYAFVCTVHAEMQGTVTVSSGETTTESVPPYGQPPEPPSPIKALRIPRNQRGSTVRGSLTLSSSATGGRLRLEVRARRAALSGGEGTLVVGRLDRTHLAAGRIPLAVSLEQPARRSLRLRGRLAVRVRIIVSPPNAAAATRTLGVVLGA